MALTLAGRIDGSAVDRIAELRHLAEDLTEFITVLRRIDPTDGPPAGRGVPLSTRDAPTRAAIDALHGSIDTGAATAVWREVLQLPGWSGPAAWVRGDLSPEIVLVADGKLSAVLDFAGVGAGVPTVDLIVACAKRHSLTDHQRLSPGSPSSLYDPSGSRTA